jgi:serine/threonine-protein kinase
MMAELAGRKLGRYEIGNLLGAGGMGSVYRARDTELKRDVAVKVLTDADTGDPNRLERFNREIQTVARLDHPNILEIHDFGHDDGVAYAVMELLKGRNLRQLIRRRLLPVDQALEIAVAVAEGLGAAHHQGVLHRDIKPENIFVTSDGTVKILDFGLARHVRPSDPDAETAPLEAELTTPGTVVGTTAYMSPEQVRGRDLDARSDIFSLGCVLYEMFSGAHPFYRDTRADTMSAILNEKPKPLSENRADLPPAVELIIAQCLNKNPEDRFDSARDVAFALQALSENRSETGLPPERAERWRKRTVRYALIGAAILVTAVCAWFAYREWFAPMPPLPDSRHLAVIRFEAAGSDPELQQLADGLTENLSQDLRFLEQQTLGEFWQVSARRRRMGRVQTIEDAHRNHNASLALTGQLERVDGRLGLDLVLHDTAARHVLREIRIEDTFNNLVSFQSAPLEAVSGLLECQLSQETLRALRSRWTTVVPSFVSYLRGLGLAAHADDAATLEASADLLLESVEADQVNGRARCAFGEVAARLVEQGTSGAWGDRGLEALATTTDSSYVDARAAEAAILSALGDAEPAIRSLEAAAASAPADAEIQVQLAKAYDAAGRALDAEAAFQRAINLRPGYWEGHHHLGMYHLLAGQYVEAANAFRAAIACAPLYYGNYTNLGMVYYQMDRHDAAQRMFERSFELKPEGNWVAVANLGTIYFDQARFDQAAEMYTRAVQLNDRDYRAWGNLGHCYAVSAQPERAEAPLRRAIELGLVRIESDPDNAATLADVAGYHSVLGQRSRGLALLERAVATEPTDPEVAARIGETYEDLGDRENALRWVEVALRGDVPPSRFENRPSLRTLVNDERYRQLVKDIG